MWIEYTEGKQTYEQLSKKHGVCAKTIKRKLDKVLVKPRFIHSRECVVLMDTTYFGRDFGVMVFKDPIGDNLYWRFVKYETIALYLEGITYLRSLGIQIKGIVCDGRKGLFKLSSEYPIQMCQFHQVAIVLRYITRRPKNQASIELKEIVHLLPRTDKESFFGLLQQWNERWSDYIAKRITDPQTGKSHYAHRRLRSAYRSLERNKEYLYTWYDNPHLGLPNTNNQLEGTFTDLKNKLRNHNGLSRKRKEKFINDYLTSAK